MKKERPATVPALILTRRGLVFVASSGVALPEKHVCGVALELAALGYALSTRLHKRLSLCTVDELTAFMNWSSSVLRVHIGADQKHVPLFRHFPDDVPDDTRELWWKRVLVHFLQADGQPCLFCRGAGTTHVLSPCCHVVCNHCFDGANYSACPICGQQVDRASPFFLPTPERGVPSEKVTFKLLDLGESLTNEVKALFMSLCERKQALSPDDRDALTVILREYKSEVLSWLPDIIPVRENVAVIFGTLFQACDPTVVLPHATRYMKTATDVLRFIAVLSGTDGSLLRETVFKTIESVEGPSRFWGQIAAMLGANAPGSRLTKVTIPLRVCRFKTAKISRPLRRVLFRLLEGLDAERLIEDMLRHQSYWVWVGEFLHPHEHAAKFPNVARAFQIVRKKAPDGTPAPHFTSWYGRLEQTIQSRNTDAILSVLAERPGEFARRFDHTLRLAANDAARERVLTTFSQKVPAFATPVLLTLRSHLSTRHDKTIRVYWPKGRIAKGASSSDERVALPRSVIGRAVQRIDTELLRRFATKPGFDDSVIDEALRKVMVPFNERTGSRSAVSLPRGSRIPVPTGKLIRLFLHWCEPEKNGQRTDLDLSVGMYDSSWNFVGVCSYYQLKAQGKGGALIAQSAGDLTSARFPDGATEFVDLHRDAAIAEGVRYVVMVVNNYSGMPFSQLERGFAGMMLRDDPGGQQFDPRTVDLKFSVDGENGIFLPLVLDLRDGVLHWLDVQSKGQFKMNNVKTSNSAITKICPELMAYFASGARASMFDLALLHAAARCKRVFVRAAVVSEFVRRPGEEIAAFHTRLLSGDADEPRSKLPAVDGPPLIAMLYRGDIDLPKSSVAYALFRERVAASLTASDLLS